jgi:ribosomal protein L37AE/L43A
VVTTQLPVSHVTCPNCKSKGLGKIATNQYYCSECCIEIKTSNGQVTSVYQIEEDGTLHSLNDLFIEKSYESIA